MQKSKVVRTCLLHLSYLLVLLRKNRLSRPRGQKTLERRKSALETYFLENEIEPKLNEFLNEMVSARPAQPFSWMARRMRREEAGGAAPVGTVPLLSPAVGSAAVGAEIEKAWAYAMGMSGETMPDISSGGAPAAKKPTGLALTIDSLGDGVLLAIREC